MTVQCMTQNEKQELYDDWMTGDFTKTELSKDFGVSTRTVTRVLDEFEEVDLEMDNSWDWEEYDDWLNDCYGEAYDYHEEHVSSKVEYHFIATPDTLTITKVEDDTYVGQVNADSDHPRFEEASDIVWSARGSQDSLEKAFEILDQKTFIEKISHGRINVDPAQNRVYYTVGDHEVDFHGRLVPRLIEAVTNPNDQELEGLINFAELLSDNPSNRAVNELYDFLEASDIKINSNGMVVCFKKVRSNYTDIYSGSFDNSPGTENRIPRNMVDEDSERTCSHGLHVCSKSYLPSFGCGPDCRVVRVLVDPSDFVAIPRDYSFAKARVSGYYVIEDITNDYNEDVMI